jgi:ferredoxin
VANNLNVTIDPDRCVGYGRCAAVATGVFMIDEDTTKAYFEEESLSTATPATIFAAARACPTQAIIVEQFGRRIYPQILAPLPGEVQRRLQEAGDPEPDRS